MKKTRGLSHISLIVADLERSLRFYEHAFGVAEYHRNDESIQVKGPGEWDVIAFERGRAAGKTGGISHFGFRLIAPEDIDEVVDTAVKAGGRLLRRGEFSPGFPYAYLEDPDGYEIEIWFE